MNKKINTLLFILGATLFNIIVAMLSIVVLWILFVVLVAPNIPETSHAMGFSLIFIIAIAVAFLVYRLVLKFLINKIDIEKYFDPIFARKHNKKN